ncbi:sensor histidine kinase [Hymenobacter bucti]|uniref:histidine kinase n=1 Tax=Hymenobacter bucti TaxID=1844114 RepID=A0ABW4QMR6_9BACT
MKLLTATNRYYLGLVAVLFAVASGALYYGINAALRHEVDEQLGLHRAQLERLVRAGEPLVATPFADQFVLSARPRRLGLADTILPDNHEHTWVPHRQLTFRLQAQGQPQWVTLRKSLVETNDLLAVVLGIMLAVLALLFGSVLLLNRWLSGRLWRQFYRTLAALRHYDLQQHQPLALSKPRIKEFAELNLAVTHLSERLVADYESLREFTANAAHETQTPLAIMQAQLEQLLQVSALADDPTAAPLLADLYGATRRLSRLHQALGLLSKIENRQFAQVQPLDLAAVLDEKVNQLEPLLEARGLRLHRQVDQAPVLTMHPGLADSLLHNLLYNAIKHNQPGGDITVHISAAALEISNPGPAISGDPSRFFERFRKHHAAAESPGLGLSIVQQIGAYYGFAVTYGYAAAGQRHTLRVAFRPAVG